jgi:16S rRNA processing protein RimM
MFPKQFRTIGTLVKPYGVEGEAIVRISFEADEIFDTEWVFLLVEGKPVPFSISDVREKTDETLILNFNDFSSPEEVEEYVDCEVLLPDNKKTGKISKTDEYNIIGYNVIDSERGEVGIIAEIVDIPGNPLLRITGITEFHIPLQADFLLKIDKKKKILFVDLPEGLIDMN